MTWNLWNLHVGRWVTLAICFLASDLPAWSQEHTLRRFARQQLTDVYYSEGANAGDLDQDGKLDVIYGPYWFRGPDFNTRFEIYPPVAQPRDFYADHFFSWVYDFNSDGWNDIFAVGFPGTPAFVYENPGRERASQHWTKHQVFDQVSNESPHFTHIVDDGRPELVCTRDGFYGYATVDWQKPFQAWTFHAVSEPVGAPKFGHGLGVGDIDGDSRLDIIASDGWFRQPDSPPGDSKWVRHSAIFTPKGGAEIHAYDVDGDGDNDVITSLAAHEYGLAWFEQRRNGDDIVFVEHLIMGDRPEHNRHGVLFTELHSVNLVDMDGDGLKDIVTGKTYWSHHTKSPMWDAGAVVYWFRLVRTGGEVEWVAYLADTESGIGRQVSVTDISGDGQPDIIVGGMRGSHMLIQTVSAVDAATWHQAQPKPFAAYTKPIPKLIPVQK